MRQKMVKLEQATKKIYDASGKYFNIYTLITQVRKIKWASEDSIKRILRKLRQQGDITYSVLNKKTGAYSK